MSLKKKIQKFSPTKEKENQTLYTQTIKSLCFLMRMLDKKSRRERKVAMETLNIETPLLPVKPRRMPEINWRISKELKLFLKEKFQRISWLKTLKSIVSADSGNLMRTRRWYNAKENAKNGSILNVWESKSIKQKETRATFVFVVITSMGWRQLAISIGTIDRKWASMLLRR